MDNQEVVRTPVTRKSIHKEYCSCHPIQVVSSDGHPQAAILNPKATLQEVQRYIDECNLTLPIHVDHSQAEQAAILLGRKVPVVIYTNRVLPDDLLRKMQAVPHSAIRLSIESLGEKARKLLGKGSAHPNELRDMMYLAKSLKISCYIHISYLPHLFSKLEMFETVEMFKAVSSHLTISFPPVSDEQLRKLKPTWEVIRQSSVDNFKRFYVADVPTRSWKVRDNYQKEMISELSDFIKSKRLTLDLLSPESWTLGGRARHSSAGYSDHMFGHGGITLQRNPEGIFEVVKDAVEEPCNICGKTIYY